MTEKITVIVPVYNVENYLEKCLDSLINQTYKNIEIIVINDGSTDNQGEICQEYAQKDNRIVYIEKENGGLSDARNVGLDKMTGSYVTFIDSDDWIEQDYIETLYKKIVEYQADIAVGNYILTMKMRKHIISIYMGIPIMRKYMTIFLFLKTYMNLKK